MAESAVFVGIPGMGLVFMNLAGNTHKEPWEANTKPEAA